MARKDINMSGIVLITSCTKYDSWATGDGSASDVGEEGRGRGGEGGGSAQNACVSRHLLHCLDACFISMFSWSTSHVNQVIFCHISTTFLLLPNKPNVANICFPQQ